LDFDCAWNRCHWYVTLFSKALVRFIVFVDLDIWVTLGFYFIYLVGDPAIKLIAGMIFFSVSPTASSARTVGIGVVALLSFKITTW
jgi:hypothetical protein